MSTKSSPPIEGNGAPPALAIEIKQLVKRYGSFAALRGIDLEIPVGTTSSLLGRNGAGKTTAIKILLGIAKATSGTFSVMGTPVRTEKERAEVRRTVAYMGDDCLFPFMTVDQFIGFRRSFFESWRRDLEAKYRDLFELPPRRRVRALSRGMQTKLGLLVAFAQGARCVILDEPTEGLDPLMRTDVLDAIRELAEAEACTLLFSSHSLAEVEQIADHVSIIHEGTVRVCASIDDIHARYASVSAELPAMVPATSVLGATGLAITRRGTSATVLTSDPDDTSELLRSHGATEIACSQPSLSEVFLAVARSDGMDHGGKPRRL